jgi:acetamidase/formamidase
MVVPVSSVFPEAQHCLLLVPSETSSSETSTGLPGRQRRQQQLRGRRHRWGNVHDTFDAKIPPALVVDAGERVHVETVDCFSGLVTPSRPELDHVEDWQLNPVTGPIYVQGAEPGDLLAVTIHDIKPAGIGVASCGTSEGQLAHTVACSYYGNNGSSGNQRNWFTKKKSTSSSSSSLTRFFDLSPDGSTVTMRDDADADAVTSDDGHPKGQHHPDGGNCDSPGPRRRRTVPISVPASPMLGVIGVAPPPEDGPIPTMPAGRHGGNLDNKHNGVGATVYLPVNVPGGLLSVGDMHASQGDGEICGCGVEIGGHVLLSCQVLKKGQAYAGGGSDGNRFVCRFPVTETATHWMTHGVAVEDIPQATVVACEEASRLLVGQWGFTPEEAFIFLSVRGDLGLCQSCHPDKGTQIARMRIPKLVGGGGACPRPFRCLLDDETETDAGH